MKCRDSIESQCRQRYGGSLILKHQCIQTKNQQQQKVRDPDKTHQVQVFPITRNPPRPFLTPAKNIPMVGTPQSPFPSNLGALSNL